VFTSNPGGSGATLNRAFLADGRELGVNYTGDVVVLTNNFMGIAPGGDGCGPAAQGGRAPSGSCPLPRLEM
jgi:hypothetical protein